MKRANVTLVAVLLAALALATQASAEQRFASPAGKGAECSADAPCGLITAISGAQKGDEVIVGAGSYAPLLPLSLDPAATDVSVHGDLAAPMPTVSVSAASSPALDVSTSGSSLSWLDVRNVGARGSGVTCTTDGEIGRVRIAVSGAEGAGLQLNRTCAVSDSLIVSTGEEGRAVAGFSSFPLDERGTVRNVTAIASGPKAVAISSRFFEDVTPSEYTLEVVNTIASGTARDLRADETIGGPGNIDVSYSNFDSVEEVGDADVKEGAANQEAPALFVDAAGGDYREALGSPTIDAGTAAGIGADRLDLAGGARTVGGKVDIGAYEFVPPTVPPPLPPPPPAPGLIQSLSLAPARFRPVNAGGAIVSARKPNAPIGTSVTYALSAPATATFTVEQMLSGRRAGKRCVKQTKANKGKRKCDRGRVVKGSFTHSGVAGANGFRFSGRLGTKALKPGRYELSGAAGGTIERVAFKIVR